MIVAVFAELCQKIRGNAKHCLLSFGLGAILSFSVVIAEGNDNTKTQVVVGD